MSDDRLRLIAEWIEAELENPGPRSACILATLRQLATLCARNAVERIGREPHVPELVTRSPDRLLRVVASMQSNLATPWTVAALAKSAGMSRAAFARAFTAAFGVPPLQHLCEQRLDRARTLLAETSEPLAAIAATVGYQSEFAFSRAFKRRYGIAPGAHRRHVRRPLSPPLAPRMRLAA